MGHAEAAVFDLPTNSDCILRSVGDAGLKHELHDKEYSYSSDPADWEITAHLRSYYAEHLPSQNLESDFTLKGRQFGDKIRYARKKYFARTLTNGLMREMTFEDVIYDFAKTKS